MRRAGDVDSAGGTAVAFVVANARYWTAVAPRVKRELGRWLARAEAIPDPTLRAFAAGKLRRESANTEAVATLCTLAPSRCRPATVEAVVALQVLYDYLDEVGEQEVDDPVSNGHQLFRSFLAAFDAERPTVDYYRFNDQSDDGGYVRELVAVARRALARLPALPTVAPVAQEAVERFAEAQTLSHAAVWAGPARLESWAERESPGWELEWWEWAAGAAASVLSLHALLAAAADPATTRAVADRIDRAYLLGSVLTTLLDSLVDDERDAAAGAHRYIAYCASRGEAADRIVAVARRAKVAATALPSAAHHVMTVSGIAAFYLSCTDPDGDAVDPVAPAIADALRPAITPSLAILRLWRKRRG